MQCQWIKADGTQCRLNAKEGEKYCSIHLRKAKVAKGDDSIPPMADIVDPLDEEKEVAVIHSNKPKKIRFVGKGSYALPSKDVYFDKKGEVKTVEHDTWLYLIENYPESFEEV